MVGAFTYYFLSGSIAALVVGASAVVLGVFIFLVKMGYYVLDNCDLWVGRLSLAANLSQRFAGGDHHEALSNGVHALSGAKFKAANLPAPSPTMELIHD